MNPDAKIIVYYDERNSRWVAFPINGYDEWHEFYDFTMTRSEVEREARAEYTRACP